MKLLSYDLSKLVSWGGIFTVLVSGTIFTMDRTLLMILLWQLVFASVAGLLACLDSNAEASSLDGLDELARYLGSFVPFVLALYVTLTMQRWWMLRTQALGPVFSCLSNVCLQISAFLPHRRYEELREDVLRYGMTCAHLMVKAARGQGNLDSLVGEEMLTEEEVSMITDVGLYQRAMIMWAWILRLIWVAWQQEKLFPPSLTPIIVQCQNARDGIETIHTYQDSQLPFAYVHLITFLVNINNAVVAVKCGVKFSIYARAIWVYDGADEPVSSISTTYWALLNELMMWFVVPVIYHGLLAISYVIHDPFGEDLLDLPIAAYTAYAFNSCRDVYSCIPCPAEVGLLPPAAPEPTPEPPPPPKPVKGLNASLAEADSRLDLVGTRLEASLLRQTSRIKEAVRSVLAGAPDPHGVGAFEPSRPPPSKSQGLSAGTEAVLAAQARNNAAKWRELADTRPAKKNEDRSAFGPGRFCGVQYGADQAVQIGSVS